MEDSELCWSLRLHGCLLCPANGKRKELKGNGNSWICLHALIISHILQSLLLSLKPWYPALGVAIDPPGGANKARHKQGTISHRNSAIVLGNLVVLCFLLVPLTFLSKHQRQPCRKRKRKENKKEREETASLLQGKGVVGGVYNPQSPLLLLSHQSWAFLLPNLGQVHLFGEWRDPESHFV